MPAKPKLNLFFIIGLRDCAVNFSVLKRNFIYGYQIRKVLQKIKIFENLLKLSLRAERNNRF